MNTLQGKCFGQDAVLPFYILSNTLITWQSSSQLSHRRLSL